MEPLIGYNRTEQNLFKTCTKYIVFFIYNIQVWKKFFWSVFEDQTSMESL